jgi:hypothetical protein
MKGIGGPGGRVGRLVMNQVKKSEQVFLVHHAVHPIKIGVVHEEHDREDRKKISPSMITNVLV